MDNALVQQISKYAEDREIDWVAAQVIGQQQGIVWESQEQLIEFKQAIDMYLKTFEVEKLDLVEEKINKFRGFSKPKITAVYGGANTQDVEAAEELTHYAATERQMRNRKRRR